MATSDQCYRGLSQHIIAWWVLRRRGHRERTDCATDQMQLSASRIRQSLSEERTVNKSNGYYPAPAQYDVDVDVV